MVSWFPISNLASVKEDQEKRFKRDYDVIFDKMTAFLIARNGYLITDANTNNEKLSMFAISNLISILEGPREETLERLRCGCFTR